MKIIKKLIRYALYITLLTFIFSCTTAEDRIETTPKRIILKELSGVNGYIVWIVEIDGIEYLMNANGGIQPLIKEH